MKGAIVARKDPTLLQLYDTVQAGGDIKDLTQLSQMIGIRCFFEYFKEDSFVFQFSISTFNTSSPFVPLIYPIFEGFKELKI